MKLTLRLILAVAAAGLGVWLWMILFPSPEKVIRRRLAKLAETASFTGKEGLIARGAGLQNLRGFFAGEVEVTFDLPLQEPQTVTGLDDLMTAAAFGQASVESLRVLVLDPNVTVSADKESAVVNATVSAKRGGERENFVQEMKFTLKKVKGTWLIFRIETVRTLSMAPQEELEGWRVGRVIATGSIPFSEPGPKGREVFVIARHKIDRL